MTPIPARLEGIQESLCPGLPSFALWTIWQGFDNHPAGSTVSIHTIEAAGFTPVETQEPGGHGALVAMERDTGIERGGG